MVLPGAVGSRRGARLSAGCMRGAGETRPFVFLLGTLRAPTRFAPPCLLGLSCQDRKKTGRQVPERLRILFAPLTRLQAALAFKPAWLSQVHFSRARSGHTPPRCPG